MTGPPGSGAGSGGSGSGAGALSAETRQPGTVRANRLVLAAFGLVLAAAGVLTLLAGFGVFGRELRAQNVLDPSLDSFVAANPWYWPVVAVIAAIVALLCLWWLLIQARSDRVATIRVSEDRIAGSTSLDAAAFTRAIEAEIAGYRGVRRVSAHLSGSPDRFRSTVRVSLDGRVDAGEVYDQVVGQAIPKARQALSAAELPCRLEFDLPKVGGRDIH